MMTRAVLLVGVAIACVGCRDWSFAEDADAGSQDAGFDAGTVDAGTDDAAGSEAGTEDGGPRDSGANDASEDSGRDAALDAGHDAGDAGCRGCECWSDALVCEDFEVTPTIETRGSGSLARIVGAAREGDFVGRFRVVAGGDAAFVRRSIPPVTTGTLWMRSFLRIPSGASVAGLVLASVGSGADIVELDLVDIGGGSDQFGVAMTFGSMDSAFAGSPSARDVWECLEVRVDVGSGGGFELFREGVSVDSRGPISTTLPSGYDSFTFGIAFSRGTQPAIDVLFDDVVLSRGRIGCDR